MTSPQDCGSPIDAALALSVVAEIVLARQFGERPGVSKVQAVARLVDCEHRVRQLLKGGGEPTSLARLIKHMESEIEGLKSAQKEGELQSEAMVKAVMRIVNPLRENFGSVEMRVQSLENAHLNEAHAGPPDGIDNVTLFEQPPEAQ